jgi:hypothetical protein
MVEAANGNRWRETLEVLREVVTRLAEIEGDMALLAKTAMAEIDGMEQIDTRLAALEAWREQMTEAGK